MRAPAPAGRPGWVSAGGRDRRCCAAHSARRTRWSTLALGPVARPWRSFGLVARALRQAEHPRKFFLDVDDQLGALELRFQSLVLALQPGDLSRLRVGFATALGRRQSLQFAASALLAPGGQMRRVQSLAAQQGTHFARLPAGRRFLEDVLLVFCAKAPPVSLGYDLGIGPGADLPVA